MELTRNHYFIAGLLLLLAGIQFRYVTSFELNEKTSQFVERRFGKPANPQPMAFLSLGNIGPSSNVRTVQPPRWLGWSLMSIGGVLLVFSLTMMHKPGS